MENKKQAKSEIGGTKDKPWHPRFWSGMTIGRLYHLFRENRFRVDFLRWLMAATQCSLSGFNNVLEIAKNWKYGRRIREQELVAPPVLIVGHWRSGTTLLHEMLIRDEQFTYAHTYDVFAAAHFLLTGRLFRPLLRWMLPAKRPMDNMAIGWERPQEDEFALCILGAMSPYSQLVAFPNNPPLPPKYLDLQQASEAEQENWKGVVDTFLRSLTVREPRRILLKSPTHTARVGLFCEMYPGAKFVHIARDPRVVIPSTYNLWMKIALVHGFQVPRGRGLEDQIFATFQVMYEAYQRDIDKLNDDQLIEIRYEDLVADPTGCIGGIYEKLGLENFEQFQPHLETFLESQKDYKKNKYEVEPELAARIEQECCWYLERFNY